MSAHASTATASPQHASVRTYIRIALVLTLITALEVGVIYIRLLTPIVVPLLLAMAAAKFALVAMYFMHLRYDPRPVSAVFVGPLLLATGLAVAVMTLTGAFLVFGR